MSRQQKCLSSSKTALLVTANILANWADFLVTLHDDRLGCDIEVAQLVFVYKSISAVSTHLDPVVLEN